MKIAFVVHELSRTGAPAVVLEFVRWLASHTDARVLTVAAADGPLKSEFARHGPVLIRASAREYGALAALRALSWSFDERIRAHDAHRLAREVATWSPDVVYCNSAAAAQLALAVTPSRAGLVLHAHELDFELDHPDVSAPLREVIRRAQRGIACSGPVRDALLARGVPHDRLSLVHSLPSDFTARPDPAESRLRLREEIGVAADDLVVGAVGTVSWRKGSDLFAQVASRVAPRIDGHAVRFVWVGTLPPAEARRLRHDITRLGVGDRLVTTGERANAAAMFSAFDVALLTSREDPFPLVMLEAAQRAVPLVAFDGSGGAAEFAAAGGALLAPYGDVEAMASRTTALLSDPEARRVAGASGLAALSRYGTTDEAYRRLWQLVEEVRA